MEDEKEKTVPVILFVPCPWRQGRLVSLEICTACQYHEKIEAKVKHTFNSKLERTEPIEIGKVVVCRFPRAIGVVPAEIPEPKAPLALPADQQAGGI